MNIISSSQYYLSLSLASLVLEALAQGLFVFPFHGSALFHVTSGMRLSVYVSRTGGFMAFILGFPFLTGRSLRWCNGTATGHRGRRAGTA